MSGLSLLHSNDAVIEFKVASTCAIVNRAFQLLSTVTWRGTALPREEKEEPALALQSFAPVI